MSKGSKQPSIAAVHADLMSEVRSVDYRVYDLESTVEFLMDEIESLKRAALQQESKMASPTFVAESSDCTVTRITTHCAEGRLDLGRGVRLAKAAYESRKNQQPPALVKGYFEAPPNGSAGKILKPIPLKNSINPMNEPKGIDQMNFQPRVMPSWRASIVFPTDGAQQREIDDG